MKKTLIIFSLVLMLAVLSTSLVSADLPGTRWWSALFMQNIGAQTGKIEMTAYGKTAKEYKSGLEDFNFGQALAYDPAKTPGGAYIGFAEKLPEGFEGSVVLSSDTAVAAISEIANYKNGTMGTSGGTAAARYQGISNSATAIDLMVPTIKHNYVGHTTTLYVQVASGSAADVKVTFNMNNNKSYTQTATIEGNRMFVFDPAAATPPVPSSGCGFNANTSPCYGSAVIESIDDTTHIAATVVEHPHSGSPAGYALSTRAQSIADQGTVLYHPTIKNNYYGKMTAGASIQNVGDAPAKVRIDLKVTGVDSSSSAKVGNTYRHELIIRPGESKLFSRGRNTLGGMPEGTFAAATITSLNDDTYNPQPLVGATNDSKISNVPGGLGITLYAGFADANKGTAIAAPIVRELNGKITGGFTVQNVGAVATQVRFYYYEYGGSNTPYIFETIKRLQVGQAINPNRISLEKNGQKFRIISGPGSFTSFSQLGGKMFSVIASTEEYGTDRYIIGIASEYHVNDARDMANYESTILDPANLP